MDYGYNAWWTNRGYFSTLWYASLNGQLASTTTGDGSTDGTGDIYLAAPPVYQPGPFGNYYTAPGSPLANAGSTTANQLGLYHYTTTTNQTAQGTAMVDIGMHYLVASNGPAGWMPLDTDGDGIPDYVEDANGNGIVDAGETDPTTQYTVSGVLDPTNTVYDDIDLSGNGLVGRIKKALGINAFSATNPLTLTQITTGQEPDIATFQMPITYNVLTNIGAVNLRMDGFGVTIDGNLPDANNNTLLQWNTTYDSPYAHFLQPEINIYQGGLDTAIISALGPVYPFYSSNVLSFFLSDSMFNDNAVYLDAQLPCSNANYSIDLYDTTGASSNLVMTITNSTAGNLIEETWNLTCSNSTHYTGTSLNAIFHVDLLDPASGASTKRLVKVTNGRSESGPNFDFTYLFTPTHSTPTKSDFANGGAIWDGMQDALDALIDPSWEYPVYQSYFNQYSAYGSEEYAGYLSSMDIITNQLWPDLANGLTKQFYCHGHGSPVVMSAANYNSSDVPHFLEEDIERILTNHVGTDGTVSYQNPYRFVFLDGCSTAARPKWEHAFGIFPLDQMSAAGRSAVNFQAMVGYQTILDGWPATSVDLGEAYTANLFSFFYEWMNRIPLAECIYDASQNSYGSAPFPVTGYGYEHYIHLQGDSYDYVYSVANHNAIHTSPIYVIGHSGLTVNGCNTLQDGEYARKN